jgi:hypothetical protein
MGAIRAPVGPIAAGAAALAAALACAHAAELARPAERPEVTGLAVFAWVVLAGSAAAGLARPAGWGVVLIAVSYAAALGVHDGSDPAAPLEAVALVLAWELCQWRAELWGWADADPAWLGRRVVFVGAEAVAAGCVAWFALAPTTAGRAGGLLLTIAGVAAAVGALGLAVRLARRGA